MPAQTAPLGTTKPAKPHTLPEPYGQYVLSAYDYVQYPLAETRAVQNAQSRQLARELSTPPIHSEGPRVEDVVFLPPRHTWAPRELSVWAQAVAGGPLSIAKQLVSKLFQRNSGRPLATPRSRQTLTPRRQRKSGRTDLLGTAIVPKGSNARVTKPGAPARHLLNATWIRLIDQLLHEHKQALTAANQVAQILGNRLQAECIVEGARDRPPQAYVTNDGSPRRYEEGIVGQTDPSTGGGHPPAPPIPHGAVDAVGGGGGDSDSSNPSGGHCTDISTDLFSGTSSSDERENTGTANNPISVSSGSPRDVSETTHSICYGSGHLHTADAVSGSRHENREVPKRQQHFYDSQNRQSPRVSTSRRPTNIVSRDGGPTSSEGSASESGAALHTGYTPSPNNSVSIGHEEWNEERCTSETDGGSCSHNQSISVLEDATAQDTAIRYFKYPVAAERYSCYDAEDNGDCMQSLTETLPTVSGVVNDCNLGVSVSSSSTSEAQSSNQENKTPSPRLWNCLRYSSHRSSGVRESDHRNSDSTLPPHPNHQSRRPSINTANEINQTRTTSRAPRRRTRQAEPSRFHNVTSAYELSHNFQSSHHFVSSNRSHRICARDADGRRRHSLSNPSTPGAETWAVLDTDTTTHQIDEVPGIHSLKQSLQSGPGVSDPPTSDQSSNQRSSTNAAATAELIQEMNTSIAALSYAIHRLEQNTQQGILAAAQRRQSNSRALGRVGPHLQAEARRLETEARKFYGTQLGQRSDRAGRRRAIKPVCGKGEKLAAKCGLS